MEPTVSSVIEAAKQLGVKVNIIEEELSDATNNSAVALEFVWQLIKVRDSVLPAVGWY